MYAQLKKKGASAALTNGLDTVTAKHFIASPMAAKHISDMKKREKKKHLAVLANTNILGDPQHPLSIIITRIGPAELVENRPAWVEFDIWNRASGKELKDLFVRARITPRQSVDDQAGIFNFPIRSLEPGQSIDGAISFILPRADTGNLITIELCQYGDIPEGGEFAPINVLASDQTEFDVAARFSIRMNGIYIRDTASLHEDTLFVSFSGQYENTSWGDSTGLGDHNNTSRSGISPDVLPVGPFNMIPGSGENMVISCVIANAGHTSTEEDAKNALKIVSKVGEVTAATVLSILFPPGAAIWSSLAAATDELHQAILDYAFADCDTVVLNDARLINEQELFLSTYDPDDNKYEDFPASLIMRSKKKRGQLIADWLGGGCRDSDYTANFAVERQRAPEMVHDSGIDGIQLNPEQEVSFGSVSLTNAKIVYDHEGNGRLDPHGLYKAPTEITDRKFDVIKWKVYEENKNGFFEVYEDFNIVILD